MLQRPRDIPNAYVSYPGSSISHQYRSHLQQYDPHQNIVVARLQPIRNYRINSFTSFESTWNTTKAKLVAQWGKIINTRHQHRLKRRMVKELTLFRNSITESQLSGPTSAGDPPSGTAWLVPSSSRAQTEDSLIREIKPIKNGFEQCLSEFSVRTEESKKRSDGFKPGDLSQKQHRSVAPMDSERKAGAARQLSHCQLDHEDAYEASEASGNSTSSSGGAESGSGDSGRGQSSRSTRSKRRLDGDDQDNSSAGGDEGDPGRGGSSKRAKKELESERKFACPFYKHDPRAHNKHRSCAGPGWPSLHRLKEHLYRAHRLPKHTCPRCNEPFEDSKDLGEHLRAEVLCEKLDVVPALQGIDEATETKLKVRKKNCPGMTDEQRWRDIYMILFPNANANTMPTPYYDGNNSLKFSKSVEEWRKAKKRIQKELPKFVQKKVEKSFEKVEVDVLKRLPDIVRDGLFEFFKDLPYDDRSPSETPAPTPRARTPSFPIAREQPAATTDELKDTTLDLSYFFEPSMPFTLGGLDDFDFSQFEFGNSGDCRFFEKESDSGYASTSTGRDGTVETDIRRVSNEMLL
ncbi:hypothetical protein F4776DRAFT_664190 [Hypoxylon sp. NC0597]|nr:hypothetical protein F4776DRAFT_664190 [Hypoxylon sp. NC0597]